MDQTTIDTYNNSAKEFAEYFRSVKTGRVEDVAKAFELLGSKANPKVIEIGCGDGRDAQLIKNYTGDYTGFDPSIGLLELAKDNLPDMNFVVGDATSFEYGENVDVVIAFASLIHVSIDNLKEVFSKVHAALNPGGIFYISLKGTDKYHEFFQDGKLGVRLFYFYQPDDIRGIARGKFEEMFFKDGFVTNGAKNWFEFALKKI